MRGRTGIVLRVVLAGAVWLATSLAASPESERARERARVGHLLRETQRVLSAGELDSAMAHVRTIREAQPRNQDALYYEALIRLAQGDTAAAVTGLEAAVKQNPLASRLKVVLARLYISGGRNTDANGLLKTVLRMKPRHSEALYLDGLLKLAQGDTSNTLDQWERALQRIEKKGAER